MTRTQGIAYQGAVYHVTARGTERRAIFRDDADRELTEKLQQRRKTR